MRLLLLNPKRQKVTPRHVIVFNSCKESIIKRIPSQLKAEANARLELARQAIRRYLKESLVVEWMYLLSAPEEEAKSFFEDMQDAMVHINNTRRTKVPKV